MSIACKAQHHSTDCFDVGKGWANGCAICEVDRLRDSMATTTALYQALKAEVDRLRNALAYCMEGGDA